MTKIVIKKISFSTYIKFVALFGGSLGLLMTLLFLLIFPTVILGDVPKEEFISMLPFALVYFLCPFICAFAFVIWGVMSYPAFLLIQKIFKKFTLEVEFPPVEYQPQQNNITEEKYVPTENNNTNQGVEE